MKYVITCLFFVIASDIWAQNKLLYEPPPHGKARIFFLIDLYHPRQRVIDLGNRHVFINGQRMLTLKTRQYAFIDVEPGIYKLAAQNNSKRVLSKTPVTELEAEADKIYYFEIEQIWEGGLEIKMWVTKRRAREIELIIEERRTRFVKTEN
jgi:hypothetical protein